MTELELAISLAVRCFTAFMLGSSAALVATYFYPIHSAEEGNAHEGKVSDWRLFTHVWSMASSYMLMLLLHLTHLPHHIAEMDALCLFMLGSAIVLGTYGISGMVYIRLKRLKQIAVIRQRQSHLESAEQDLVQLTSRLEKLSPPDK